MEKYHRYCFFTSEDHTVKKSLIVRLNDGAILSYPKYKNDNTMNHTIPVVCLEVLD